MSYQEKLEEGERAEVLKYLLPRACKVESIWMFDVVSERGEIKDQYPGMPKLFPCNMNFK